jgi:type I site-specific restriction endonuclease
MNDRQVIWDPLRRKEVALTPEEKVRQWCIGVLMQQCQVPAHMMMSEAAFRLGGKMFRADILVYDRQARPLMVVECKRPEVSISQEVLDQAIRYNMVLNVRYILLTNGSTTYVCRREDNDGTVRYGFIDSVPAYNEMID